MRKTLSPILIIALVLSPVLVVEMKGLELLPLSTPPLTIYILSLLGKSLVLLDSFYGDTEAIIVIDNIVSIFRHCR